MRRFYARPENITADSARLEAEEMHHLRDVLRLRGGDPASVFDGKGNEYACQIEAISKNSATLSIVETTESPAPESPLEITLASTVLNGEKYDLIVQKAVELGVVRLLPMQTIRGEVKAKDAAKRLDRWRRIALEATKQSGRSTLMEIAGPMTFNEVIEAGDAGQMVMFSERDGTRLDSFSAKKRITALIGPKGGWDDLELTSASDRGIAVITLGGRILRAETAAIALTAILQNRFGDLN